MVCHWGRVIPDVLRDHIDRSLLARLDHEGGGTTFLENVGGTTHPVTQSDKTRDLNLLLLRTSNLAN